MVNNNLTIPDGEKKNNVAKNFRKIKHRTELLSRTKLTENFTYTFNQWISSLVHYYTGILNFHNDATSILDKQIRQILIKNKLHHKYACPERLYIKRNLLGRGINNMELKIEKLQIKILSKYKQNAISNPKYPAIIKC